MTKKPVTERIIITKPKFEAYEIIRTSGDTNMFDTKTVCKLSHQLGEGGLTSLEVVDILKYYNKYLTRWPEVRRHTR